MTQRIAALIGTALLVGLPLVASAMCIPFYCEDCDLQARGQLNFVVMDREAGRIRLIPNVRIEGNAESFALLVPTPTVPDFMPVDRTLWEDAFALTAPMRVRNRNSGCDHTTDAPVPASGDAEIAFDVVVVGEQTVGDFIATTVSATTSAALVTWLNEHNFSFTEADIAAFDPYVAAHWVFTAMLLDPSVEAPPTWDTSVDPVELSFEADVLEVPLPLLAIHRAEDFPVIFFVVDDHRTDLAGFQTTYADRITQHELWSIRNRYPAVGAFLESGRFLTRLDHRFPASEAMDASILLQPAPTDEEMRRVTGPFTPFGASIPAPLAVVAALFLGRELNRRRRRSH